MIREELYSKAMTDTVKIVTEGNPVLRNVAATVPVGEIQSERIQKIIADMSAALYKTEDGIGIAAPQIGESVRIFIASEEALEHDSAGAEKSKTDWRHFAFINPEIVNQSKKQLEDPEGCLSIPGVYGTVQRSEKVKIRAYNEKGEKVERGASGLFAILLQHEVDHLNGILFIDKAENLRKISVD